MAREIAEIPGAAENQLLHTDCLLAAAERIRVFKPRVVVVCGRGSSGHVGTFLRYLFEARLGVLVCAAAPSLVTAYDARPDMHGTLFIVVSQSGLSPDLVATTARADECGALTLAIVNNADAPVARAAQLTLAIEAGQENSVAATKTVVLSMLAGAHLVAALTQDSALARAIARLPDRLVEAHECDWSAWTESLERAPAAFVAARGLGLAPAREIALKLTETLRLPALAWSTAELLHGPRAAITPATPVLVVRLEDQTAASVDGVARELSSSGATLFIAGDSGASLPWMATDHPACDAIAMLLPAYRAIEAAARHRGFDPDHPPHLSKVTRTL